MSDQEVICDFEIMRVYKLIEDFLSSIIDVLFDYKSNDNESRKETNISFARTEVSSK
jgi:hypothetical protein